MKNFGINTIGVPIYQTGTSKGGVQTWTSEDYDPVMYKKVTPIEKQKDLVYRNRQKQGVKNFDKGFKTLWGVMQLHPTTALGTDLIDGANALKQRNANEYLLNTNSVAGKSFEAANQGLKPKSTYKNVVKYHRAVAGSILGPSLSFIFRFPDMIDDGIDLYNTVTK